MSFTEAVTSAFTKYATFSGRARRSEYWYFALFNMVVGLVLTFIGGMIFRDKPQMLSSIYSLAALIPNLAVSWRRLHDIGRSGGWYFLWLVPIVGWIILLIWMCTDSQPGDNQYGPCPK